MEHKIIKRSIEKFMKILFIDGTKGFSPTRIDEKPCGGIITSLTLIPQYLAKQNHDVYVISEYKKEEVFKGVTYTNKFTSVIKPDIVVLNRNAINNYLLSLYPTAKYIWWLHDIVQITYLNDNAFQAVDKIVALSDYCKNSYSDFYNIPKDKFTVIQNGVDEKVFNKGNTTVNNDLFVCASAPIKGLQPIEFTFYNMQRNNPNVELRIYSSQKLHDFEDTNKKIFDNFRNRGIKVCDPIPQKELAKVFQQARGLLMPNSYPEICSNLILQAQACGCPVITTPIGSAPEFIKHRKTGLLTETYPHDMFLWWKEYAELSVELMKNNLLFDTISSEASKQIPTWDDIGETWNNLIEER
jgi:glycosyltransferase involved in cell wall biosynthesis